VFRDRKLMVLGTEQLGDGLRITSRCRRTSLNPTERHRLPRLGCAGGETSGRRRRTNRSTRTGRHRRAHRENHADAAPDSSSVEERHQPGRRARPSHQRIALGMAVVTFSSMSPAPRPVRTRNPLADAGETRWLARCTVAVREVLPSDALVDLSSTLGRRGIA